MDDLPSPLAQLAAAAEIHARERHLLSLEQGDWEQLDRILDQERQQGQVAEQESIALCYGAWIGESLVRMRLGEWTGLSEPVPPRIRIGSACYSPMDAVQRRLVSAEARPVSQLMREVHFMPAAEASRAVEQNRDAWNARSNDPAWVSRHFSPPDCRDQVRAALDPWLAGIDLDQKEVLCLAAAGGTHGPLYAVAGARVMVVDFSPMLLAIDDEIARRFNLKLQTRTADLRDLSFLPNQSFDVVLQPVSTSYIPDVLPMYRDVFRAMKPGGVYLSQHKSPASLQSGEWVDSLSGYLVSAGAGSGTLLPSGERFRTPQRESGMSEFLHSLDDLIGGLCRTGFVLEDVTEPVRSDGWSQPGTTAHRAGYFPPYLKLKARRPAGQPGRARQES